MDLAIDRCRTPHGVRELKHPRRVLPQRLRRRTPHGVRELKLEPATGHRWRPCRTPHGVRELKPGGEGAAVIDKGSHPSRGA